MTSPLAARLLRHVLAAGSAAPRPGAGRAAPPGGDGGGAHGEPAFRLGVIGLSKNAGKTVTLNHLIRAASGAGLALGLLSTGRDGEEKDAVTELPKPRIWVPAGAVVATARAAAELGAAPVPAPEPGRARLRVLHETGCLTPFGPVVIARAETAGEVLLIGPGSARRIADLLALLEAHGAALCLVDGSFDRIAAAAPVVTGRVVLAAGAAYSGSMGETVAQVRHLLDLFDLPPVPASLEGVAREAAAAAPVSLISPAGSIRPLPVRSALAAPDAVLTAAAQAEPGSRLLVTGAVSDRLLQGLLARRLFAIGLVAQDPTHILVGRDLWRRWRSQGGQACVRRPVRLLAITTNPHSPVGTDYDPLAFAEAVAAMAGPDRPVFDLESGIALPR